MSLFKSASLVSLWTLVSRITGLARELIVAATFGASAMTDAFNVAFRIPNLLRRLFAEGAFRQAFVPVLAASKEKDGEAATKLLIDQVANVLLWALIITCAIGVIAAPILVYAMASGLQQDPRAFDASVAMTRFMFPYIAFMSLAALAAGVLNTWKKFAVPAATPVLLNIAMIASAWLLMPQFRARGIEPIYALAFGVMLGGVLQLGVQLIALKRLDLLPRFKLNPASAQKMWAQPAIKNIVKLMLPALLGVSVAQLSLLINTQIASHLQAGSVSWLTYADRLMEFPTAMLGVALGVVLMPQLAAARAGGDSDKYSSMIDWGLRLVVLLGVPCAVALLCFAKPLVSVLYHYGAFTSRDVSMVTTALMGYGAGLLGLVAIKVLAPAYYAKQDIKTPVKIAIVVLILTQLMNIVFVPERFLGLAHAGLALSIGLGAMVNALWLLVGLLRSKTFMPRPGWGRFALQVLAASSLLAAFLLWASTSFDWTGMQSESLKRIGVLALMMCASAAIYFVACAVSGIKLRALIRR
jgi:putative peptidoglycan lipid II flippase